MNLSEIITFTTLKGDVICHKEFKDSAEIKGKRFSFQFNCGKDLITIQYWKLDGKLTFITGTYHERDPKLGTLLHPIKNVDQLFELIK